MKTTHLTRLIGRGYVVDKEQRRTKRRRGDSDAIPTRAWRNRDGSDRKAGKTHTWTSSTSLLTLSSARSMSSLLLMSHSTTVNLPPFPPVVDGEDDQADWHWEATDWSSAGRRARRRRLAPACVRRRIEDRRIVRMGRAQGRREIVRETAGVSRARSPDMRGRSGQADVPWRKEERWPCRFLFASKRASTRSAFKTPRETFRRKQEQGGRADLRMRP